MRHRSVGDLMTPVAVSVQRGTTLKEIVRILDEYDITAVPVVEDDRPVGVVSEADVVFKQTLGGTARTAEELMTSPAVVAGTEWSIVRAARMMEEHRIKRLPVVDDVGRLIGVISRSDLIQLFLRRDRAIQEEIVEEIIAGTLGLSPAAVTVEVDDGKVTLSGTVARRSLVPVVVRLCESVDGVVDVVDRLGYDQDDTTDTAAGGDGLHTGQGAGR